MKSKPNIMTIKNLKFSKYLKHDIMEKKLINFFLNEHLNERVIIPKVIYFLNAKCITI